MFISFTSETWFENFLIFTKQLRAKFRRSIQKGLIKVGVGEFVELYENRRILDKYLTARHECKQSTEIYIASPKFVLVFQNKFRITENVQGVRKSNSYQCYHF